MASNQIGDTFAPGGTELYASGKTDKKEERRRKAAGQTSSSKQGMQVREKKTHKIKEKGGKSSRSHNEEDLEDEGGSGLGRSLHFMSSEEVSYDCACMMDVWICAHTLTSNLWV